MEDNKVTVRIYGQEYTISGERDPETIQEIAAYVDEKMREISKFTASNKAGALATLACVNMADEVFSMREELDGLRQEKEQLENDAQHYMKLWDEAKQNFIQYKLHEMRCGYKFLLFVGSGEAVNGLPVKLQTRLANRLHRRIYLEVNHHHDAVGIVSDCHYYDRTYRQRTKVIPQMLTTVFVPFDSDSILQMVNRELDCDFTDLVVIDNTIDFEGNSYALCGNI